MSDAKQPGNLSPALGGFVFLALLGGGYYMISQPADRAQRAAERAKDACEKPYAAFAMSKVFIKEKLKAPASASFPRLSEPDVHVTTLGGCAFTVKAYVDAQNDYGAKLRSVYSMHLTYSAGDDMWSATNIVLR